MRLTIEKASYQIKGIEIGGIIITTRKQLENCNIEIFCNNKTN